MTQWQRAALGLLLLVAAAIGGWWAWTHRAASTAPLPVEPTLTATATPAAAAVGTPAALQPPPGYRLAGVAVGEPDSFAVVELPGGTSALYRTNAEVPGLGRLLRIDAERVVVQTEAGQFDLWLSPAPTPSPPAEPTATARAPAARTPRSRSGAVAPRASRPRLQHAPATRAPKRRL